MYIAIRFARELPEFFDSLAAAVKRARIAAYTHSAKEVRLLRPIDLEQLFQARQNGSDIDIQICQFGQKNMGHVRAHRHMWCH